MIFDSKSLNDAIVSQLKDAGVPDDHKNAFVIMGTTAGGVKGVLTTKVGDHWQVDSMFAVAHDKPIEGGVQIKATW